MGIGQLDIHLPGAEKAEIDLYQGTTDVVIKMGNFKRNIPLPNALRTYAVSGAKFEDGVLQVTFAKEENDDAEK